MRSEQGGRSEGGGDMQASRKYRLFLKIQDNALAVGKVQALEGEAPEGDTPPNEPVSQGVIGHWIDLADDNQNVIYRRFLHNTLPFHLSEVLPKWSQRRRTRTKFVIDLPALEGASKCRLYEQSLTSAAQHEPERRCYVCIDLTQYQPRK